MDIIHVGAGAGDFLKNGVDRFLRKLKLHSDEIIIVQLFSMHSLVFYIVLKNLQNKPFSLKIMSKKLLT